MNVKLSFVNFASFTTGRHISPHSHNCHEVVFYGMGCSGTTVINDTEYTFSAGDVAVINRNSVHHESHSSDGKVRFFGFECEQNLPIPNGIYRNLWNIDLIISIIHRESINQNYLYEELISNKINELIVYITRTLFPEVNATKNLTYFKNYISENYMQPINIYDIAKLAGYSYSHFRHLFTKYFDISPKKYLIDVRCQKAFELLKTTEISCAEIAYRCGFSDSGQMTKMFKEKYSLTPLVVRKTTNKI